MAKTWEKAEITYLKRYAARKTLDELAERFEVNPKVLRGRLAELGLSAKDSEEPVPTPDPLVKVYERGLKALGGGRWADGAKAFTRVVAESEQADLAERARRFLEICRARLDTEPAAGDEDPFLRAVYERNRGNLEEALALCSRGGRQAKDERFAYLAASIMALTGDHAKAAKHLARAIELNPQNRIHAHYDSDFDELRSDSEYRSLFE